MLGGIYTVGTKESREACIRDLRMNEKVYNYYNGIKFESILDIYKYCKKNKITSGDITNKYGVWGDVASLIKMKQKEVIAYYGE